MKLIGHIEIDLEEIFTGEQWEETVADIIRDELKSVIRNELKKEFKENITFTGAMKKVRERAAQEIIAMVLRWKEISPK